MDNDRPTTGSKFAWYLLDDDTVAQRRWMVNESPFRIGRHPEMSLPVSDNTVSKRHAELVCDGEQLLVRDLESTNGTFLNGVRVRQSEVSSGDVLQLAKKVFRVIREVSVPVVRQTIPRRTISWSSPLLQFDQLVKRRAVVPHYRPIMRLDQGQLVGYDLVAGSHVKGLESSTAMFCAATQLDRVGELSMVVRWVGAVRCQRLPLAGDLFLKAHPSEIEKPMLRKSLRELRDLLPSQKLTLQLPDAAIGSAPAMRRLRDELRSLQIRLAYRFSGEASRLTELLAVPPDVVKFEPPQGRDAHQDSPQRLRKLKSLVQVVAQVGALPLAEGVESADDAAACRDAGFQWAQGEYCGPSLFVESTRQTPWSEQSSATICT